MTKWANELWLDYHLSLTSETILAENSEPCQHVAPPHEKRLRRHSAARGPGDHWNVALTVGSGV